MSTAVAANSSDYRFDAKECVASECGKPSGARSAAAAVAQDIANFVMANMHLNDDQINFKNDRAFAVNLAASSGIKQGGFNFAFADTPQQSVQSVPNVVSSSGNVLG